MKTLVAFTILCCSLVLLPGVSVAQSPDGNEVMWTVTMLDGFVDTPITADANLDMMCARGVPIDDQYVGTWDFGPGATPATAVVAGVMCEGGSGICFPSASVTYPTAGDKMVTFRVTHAGALFGTYPKTIRIYDYEKVAIPHDAVVIDSNTQLDRITSKSYWLNPGVTLHFGTTSGDTVTFFAEPGSTISGYVYNCRFYMKHGSALKAEYPSYGNDVIYGDGAIINTDNTNSNLNNPNLDFDYTNAPANAAFSSSGVEMEAIAKAISIAPNPTKTNISIAGIPQNVLDISILDMLGATMLHFERPASDMQIDLSRLPAGVYYVRFTMPGMVVTKRIIKD